MMNLKNPTKDDSYVFVLYTQLVYFYFEEIHFKVSSFSVNPRKNG